MAATPRQEEAIRSHDQSTVVTAGAGTGKTFVLVQKYIDLIESKKIPVPQILALTFTEKAAAEMKERIRREIHARSGAQWERAAEEFMVAPVQTFHSFCAQVLREFPIEAGLVPGFVVLDEQQMGRIHAAAFDELVQTPQEKPVQRAAAHVLALTGQMTLSDMLAAMYQQRSRYLRFFAALGADPAGVIAFWQQEVHRFRDEEIRLLAADHGLGEIVRTLLALGERYGATDDKAARHLSGLLPHLRLLVPETSPEEFCRAASAIRELRMGNVGSRKNWGEGDLEKFRATRRSLLDLLHQRAPLLRLGVDPADPRLTTSIRFLNELAIVFRRYLALTADAKAKDGGLDFSDLILHALQIFTEQRELVATHFTRRFRYILVDEFQDTDPAQFEIVLALVGELSPRTDCLFLVGDPKQSIYLFREADVTRFKEAQRIIGQACGGLTVNLDTSFRSTKEVIGFTNHLFLSLFASAERAFEFGYEPIRTSPARAEQAGSVELLLPPRGEQSADTKRNEAEMVGRRIHALVKGDPVDVYEENPDHRWQKRPARYGDLAILLAQRTNLEYYLSSLARAGIPYYVHGGTGFYGRQEIYDLFNLLCFLENGHSDVSLVGVLRSPYFGISDAELFLLSRGPGTIFERLVQYAETSGSKGAVRAVTLLAGWQEYAGRTGLVTLIRKILAGSGLYTVYGALPEGQQILANIEKLIAIVRAREEKGYALADLVADLKVAMDKEEREGEAPLDALATNAVNIMTIHAAKGLEFPVVIVPDLGTSFRDHSPAIMIGDDFRMVGVQVPDPSDNFVSADTPVLAALREMQRQKERAERKRLLYVALTRARDHLILSGTLPEVVQPSEFAKTRIEWVWNGLGVTAKNVAAGWCDAGGVRIRLISDPLAIPAEYGGVKPERVEVPPECSGGTGTFVRPVLPLVPDAGRVIPVSELEGDHRVHAPRVSKYLPGVDGARKGTIIHEVLRGRDASAVLEEYGEFSEEHLRQCEEIIAAFFSTDLMKRVKRSFCEVPFVLTLGTRRVTGKIDRLCELDDGSWVVIDYKSEVAEPEEFPLVGEAYAESIRIYCEAARGLVGYPVSGYLYFTEIGVFYPAGS